MRAALGALGEPYASEMAQHAEMGGQTLVADGPGPLIRVLQWNVNRAAGDRRRRQVETLAREDADLVVLTEVASVTATWVTRSGRMVRTGPLRELRVRGD